MPIIERLIVGPLQVNCYVLGEKIGGEGIVIDAGGDTPLILKTIKEHELKIKYLVNTHSHFDHIGAIEKVREATGGTFVIHRAGEGMLASAKERAKEFLGLDIEEPPKADGYVDDGELISVQGVRLKVLFTPGHSPGGICLLFGEHVFTGDTLFEGSVGRTDTPGASWQQLIDSIKSKLLPLDDDIRIHPGHGPPSSIGVEREFNPFLQKLKD